MRRQHTQPDPGRSVDATTQLLTAHLSTQTRLSAADRAWVRRRHRDLVLLYVELALTIAYLLLVVMVNVVAILWGFGLILLASFVVVITEWITGFYHRPQAANRPEYAARAAADQLVGNVTSSAQSRFLGRHAAKED